MDEIYLSKSITSYIFFSFYQNKIEIHKYLFMKLILCFERNIKKKKNLKLNNYPVGIHDWELTSKTICMFSFEIFMFIFN